MKYATTPQTNVISSQHYATPAPQYYTNPFDAFGETGFAVPAADPNVTNTNFNTVGYSVQAASQHSNDYVQHTQHQMQYSTNNQESIPNQTMNFQTQNHQHYSQTSQPYQQQYPQQQYYHNQSQY
jgi:hypothetical protein